MIQRMEMVDQGKIKCRYDVTMDENQKMRMMKALMMKLILFSEKITNKLNQ